MKIENPIKWCDETINAVTGCDRVSAGCKNCYAESGTRARVLRSQGIETWGTNGVRHPVNFEPTFRKLNKLCLCDKCHTAYPINQLGQKCKIELGSFIPNETKNCNGNLRRIRLFADSNSDWLDEKWPIETLAKFLDAIRLAPNVDVLLLTKRPENFFSRLNEVLDWAKIDLGEPHWVKDWLHGMAPENLWLGVSVENQAMANKRIPILLKIPAAVRFLSAEPLLEKVDLKSESGIDWVIVGGESGQHRRDCGVEAINSIAEQCVTSDIPVFVKQDTSLFSGAQGRIPDNIFALKQFPKIKKEIRQPETKREAMLL